MPYNLSYLRRRSNDYKTLFIEVISVYAEKHTIHGNILSLKDSDVCGINYFTIFILFKKDKLCRIKNIVVIL